MNAKQIAQTFLILVFMIFMVWLAFYFLIAALVIGACVTAYFYIKRFLIQKGFINPPMRAPSASDMSGDVIDAEYKEIDKD